jgi:transposase
MVSKEMQMVLRALYRQGWSIAALARAFSLSWRTANRHAKSDAPVRYTPRACPADLSEEQLGHVVRRLGVCDKIRATTLYREVKELGYEASYPSFARRVRALRPIQEPESEVRFETDPGVQTQVDWATLGAWPLGTDVVEFKVLVGVLGFSRHVAMRFATDQTRATTLALVPWVLHELGGVTQEVLTDRDSVFVIGETSDKRAIFAPEWVDLTLSLGTAPKACRAYRAKTKGKVERVIREVKEDFVPWLTGQALPPRPSIFDYDELGRRWATEVVGPRKHRTTGRIVSEAWLEELPLLNRIPDRLLVEVIGATVDMSNVVDLTAALKARGAVVDHRSLADYEVDE